MTLLKKLQDAWNYRKDWIRKEGLEAFRLVHGAGDGLSGLTIDFYRGSFLVALREARWVGEREALIQALQELSREILPLGVPYFFWIYNFPSSPPSPPTSSVQTKQVSEGDLHFEVHLGSGLHTGLFLDQRENRRFLRAESRGRRVLNLFSHTGAFTVAALKGGAREALSVDLSKNYLNGMKRNLELNHLEAASAPAVAMDVFDYLKKAEKKGERFDRIILDPPTFSRGKKMNFSTEKDLADLISRTVRILSPNGRLFVSVNTQRLTPNQFQRQILEAVSPRGLKILKAFPLPLDFRLTPEEKKNPHLKSAWVG